MPNTMDRRRLTYFPRTGNHTSSGAIATISEISPEVIVASKRDLHGRTGVNDIKLPTSEKLVKKLHRTHTPISENPEVHYQCVYLVDPEGKRPYCLAQEKVSYDNESPYRIVMIRRSVERAVVGLSRPHPNLVNIISVFRFDASLFIVFDQPGLSLSDIALSQSPQLGSPEIKTISTEVLSGICALGDAGFFLPKIEVENINVSGYDGRVKVGCDNATDQEQKTVCEAMPFKSMLEDLIACLPNPATGEQNAKLCAFIQSASSMSYPELQRDEYLRDSLPARSLIPFVLTAQVSVIPLEHAIETRIINLRESEECT